MKRALVLGMNKTGTTIVATVIWNSIAPALLEMERHNVAFFEKHRGSSTPLVVKLLYEHWIERQCLLTGIVRGETGFRADRTVAIVRDPRDSVISGLMYSAYHCVINGAGRDQVNEWVQIVRDKETNPGKYSVIRLIEHHNRIFDTRHTPDGLFQTFISYAAWMANNTDYFHVLRYEDFVAGNVDTLSAYLGIELSTSREVDPVVQRVARSRQSGEWRKMMLPEDVAYLQERYGGLLEAHGYSDWEIHPEECDPAIGSQYILRITDEAFRSEQQESAGMQSRPR